MIAQPLANMSPIFLLHMGIVVFMIGAATGKLDRFFSFGEVS